MGFALGFSFGWKIITSVGVVDRDCFILGLWLLFHLLKGKSIVLLLKNKSKVS